MSKRVFRRAALATAGAAALTLATTLPGDAATTAEWRLSGYASSVTGVMTSVAAISKTDAWAVGNTQHGTTPVNSPYVVHWNGSTWSKVSIPGSNGYLSVIVAASSASNVWVLGTDWNDPLNQKLFHYDGSHWHTVSVPEADNLHTLVALSPTDVWVTGQSGCTSPAKCSTDVFQWNGSTWTAHPIYSTVWNIAGTSATNVWAVGLNNLNSKGEGTLSAYRWNGTKWLTVVMPHPGMYEWPDIAIGSASDIWIEGWRAGSTKVLALRWTGSTWQQVLSGANDSSSVEPVPYGSSGVWLGPWELWNGHAMVATDASLPWANGTMQDFVAIPGASGSFWGAASAEKSANSSVDHPAMVIYGPVP